VSEDPTNLIEMAADIVSAYVANNSVSADDLPNFIRQVHDALKGISTVRRKLPPLKSLPPPSLSARRFSRITSWTSSPAKSSSRSNATFELSTT
jgi:predicted transcriptional regulator